MTPSERSVSTTEAIVPTSSVTFWSRWLVAIGVMLGLLGVLLNLPMTADMFDSLVDPVFWKGQPMPDDAQAFKLFIYGVLGATMVGWGILLAVIARIPFRRGERWAWQCLLTMSMLWFCCGVAISLRAGVYANVIADVLFLFLLVVPLVVTRRVFLCPPQAVSHQR